jgi:signal transduction histidine kinase
LPSSNLAPDIRVKNWRINLDLFGYLAVTASIASTLSRFNYIANFRDFIINFLIHSAAFIALYYFWLVAAIRVRKRGVSTLTIWPIMSIGFLGGIIYTLTLRASAWVFEVQLTPDFLTQLVGFAVPAAFWLPASSVISNNYRRYLQIKQDAQDELLQQESVKLARARALEEYRKKLEEQIQDSLKVTTREAATLFESLKESEIKTLPGHLRVISGEYFRLVSHKLVAQSQVKGTLLKRILLGVGSVVETVQVSIAARPLNPLWYAVMVSITALPALVQKRDPVLIIEIMLVIFISSLIIQIAQLQIAIHYKVNLMKLAIITLILNTVIPLALVRVLPTNNVERYYPGAFLILVLAVNFLGHLAQAGLLKEEDFRTRSLEAVELVKQGEKEASLMFAGITRNWARYIHGSYTSKLESSALALETALRDNDFAEVEKAIAEVGNFLKAQEIHQPMPQEVLIDEIDERCKNWAGLIEFEIDANIDRQDDVGVSIHQVGACIEEAILNASRHGNCSWIGIEIVNTELLFTIIFKDNGVGFSSNKHGFGSQIFTEATDGQWELWRDERRKLTVLHLNFKKIT